MTTEAGWAAREARAPLDFDPVPRAPTRADGWSAEKQRAFIAALAATGSVRLATEAVGMSWCGVYKLRTAPGGESFAAAWEDAVRMGATNVRDVLFDQTINGMPEEVWHQGARVGMRRKFNHASMKWLLRHHLPETYGDVRPFGGRRDAWAKPEPTPEEVRASILRKLDAIERQQFRELGPAEREAWAVLYGPGAGAGSGEAAAE